MRSLTVLSAVLLAFLTGCAPRYLLTREGATLDDYNSDIARCDYETSAATQGTDPGLRTVVGQEFDRASRKNDLMKKCMLARGWRIAPATSKPETAR